MLTALVLAQESNEQIGLPKNMISGPGWFDRDRTKFKDQWRGMRLFLKSNRVMKTDNKITAILAYLRRDIADIYVQKKLDELNEETEIQDQDKFVQEIKTTFSDKTKTADAR